ncbi:RusA family crossover junction endodeoxyribonuclease, partial [Pseudomonas urmiensis]|uniref:RusA family crossover junction endodeoxyribonuclease n=1 Tax=Pseudomonas urmiensis TaxID=2745493 RepID=UPI0034D3DB70
GIPSSTSKKNRIGMLNGDIYPTKKPDADNIAKAVTDALNGLAYKDDSQIVILSVYKQYGETPQVGVTINTI